MQLFDSDRPVLGMVHLDPLPGAPRFGGNRDAVREAALRDARRLESGGVDGVVVENFGDAPFYPDDVPKHVVASVTAHVDAVCREVDAPVGVNVLRNDAEAAVSVAAATDAAFVRVNVHTGARATDQGVVAGHAHETLRLRDRLDADAAVFADVAVKHSASLGGEEDPAADAAEAIDRGLADAVVVSGPATGEAVDRETLEAVAAACERRGAPAFVGSGVTPGTVADLLSVADGAIVGTALKKGSETTAPVSEDRVRDLLAAADRAE